MAIALTASNTSSALGGTTNITPSLGGNTGDIVFVFVATGSAADRTLSLTDGADGTWTKLSPELYAGGGSRNTNLAVWWKFVGATPDSTYTITGGSTNAADALTCGYAAFSGVDPTTPFDVAFTTVAVGNNANYMPNPAAITPGTSGAAVFAIGAGAATTGVAFTNPGGYVSGTNEFRSRTQSDTNDSIIFFGLMTLNWTSGAVDPPLVTGGSSEAGTSYAAYTIALRPTSLVHYTMPVTPGVYTQTGTAAGLLRGYLVGVTPGSYTYTGTAVTLAKGLSMSVTPGSYGLTGTAAGLLRGYSVPVTPGVYSLTGTTTGLTVETTNGRNVVSLLGTPSFDTTAGNKSVTATPAVDDLILLVVAATSTTGSQTMSVSDSQGGSYSLVQSASKNTNLDNVRVYVRDTLIEAATSTIFSVTTTGDTGGGIAVLKVTNMGRYSGAAIRRTARQDNQVSGAPAPSYIGAANPKDATVGVVLNDLNPASLSPPVGWTELYDNGYATPTTGLHIVKRDGGFSGTTISWIESGFGFASIILDLNSDAGLIAAPGVYTMTGTGPNLLFGRAPALTPGVYSLTGTAATLTYTPAPTGYSMNADIGAYNITGTSIGFLYGRSMSITPWFYGMIGDPVTFLRTYILPVTPGSYSVTGTAASLLFGRSVTATPGSYTLTGTAVNFLRGVAMAADPGTYAITGTATAFFWGKAVVVTPGVYTMTGTAVNFRESAIVMDMAPGTYAVAGTDVAFLKGRTMPADPGVYSLTGSAATFPRTYVLTAVAGSYAVTGTAASLLRARAVTATPGVYTVNGTAVNFLLGRVLQADPGTYTYTGTTVAFFKLTNYVMPAAAGSYSLTGTPVSMAIGAFLFWLVEPDPPAGTVGIQVDPGAGLWTVEADPGVRAVGTAASPLSGIWTVEADPPAGTVIGS